MGLVSIIIPCYNYGWLLAETLDSVLAQTHQDWECIIVDDGSMDETRLVAAKYQAQDSRFLYTHQNNAGISAARNHGLQLAQGEYVQFLDADDLLAPKKLETQIQLLAAHPEFDLVYGTVRYFRHGEPAVLSRSFDMLDNAWQVELRGQGNAVVAAMIERNVIVMNAPLLRAALVRRVGPFAVGMHSMEDWDFWLRCALAGAYFYYDERPEMWVFVRVHSASTSQNRVRMQLFEQEVRTQLAEKLREAGFEKSRLLNEDSLNKLRHDNAVYHLTQGHMGLGLQAYWQLARESGRYLTYAKGALYWLSRRRLPKVASDSVPS